MTYEEAKTLVGSRLAEMYSEMCTVKEVQNTDIDGEGSLFEANGMYILVMPKFIQIESIYTLNFDEVTNPDFVFMALSAILDNHLENQETVRAYVEIRDLNPRDMKNGDNQERLNNFLNQY